jgi:hypothetical protein
MEVQIAMLYFSVKCVVTIRMSECHKINFNICIYVMSGATRSGYHKKITIFRLFYTNYDLLFGCDKTLQYYIDTTLGTETVILSAEKYISRKWNINI